MAFKHDHQYTNPIIVEDEDTENLEATKSNEDKVENEVSRASKRTLKSLNILSDEESDDECGEPSTKIGKYSGNWSDLPDAEISGSSFSRSFLEKRSSTPIPTAGPSSHWVDHVKKESKPTPINRQDCMENKENNSRSINQSSGSGGYLQSFSNNYYSYSGSSDSMDDVTVSNIRGMFSMAAESQVESNQTHFEDESHELEVFFHGEIQGEDYIELESFNLTNVKEEVVTTAGSVSDLRNRIAATHGQKKPSYEGRSTRMVSNDVLENIKNSLDTCPLEDALMKQPFGLRSSVKLMDHQRYALSFMSWRERNVNPTGGILADEMGTGKTLTILGMILLDKENPDPEEGRSEEAGHSRWMNSGRMNRNLPKGGTLVVCPATLMQQWRHEVDTKCLPGIIDEYRYHGPGRLSNARELANKYDLVVTTYGTLNGDLQKGGPLFRINWHRVVLDEGHIIRNHTTANAVACFQLITTRRWILTGTPIHNYMKDMFSVMHFLKCRPFNDIDYWNAYIGRIDAKERGLARLHAILKTLMLRRTKAELEEKKILAKLPEKTVKTVKVELCPDEQKIYQKFLLFSQTLFVEYLHQREKSTRKDEKFRQKTHFLYEQIAKAYRSRLDEISTMFIFELLLRLRQICCHPNLLKINVNEDAPTTSAHSSNHYPNLVDVVDQLVISEKEYIALTNLPELNYDKEILRARKASTKLSLVLEDMEKILKKGGEKIVVISQWTQFLDILEDHLIQRGWRFLMLTGKTKISDRGDILSMFNDPQNHIRILLISLGTGGVGLNLTGANNIFLMDSHWNPQWELQAEDRVHRIGQKKPVTIYKYLTENSIEERILELQKKKLELAKTVLTGAKRTQRGGITIDDLRLLFNMQ